MKTVSLAGLPEEGVSHDPSIRKQVLLRRGDVPRLTGFARARLACTGAEELVLLYFGIAPEG